MTRAAINWIFDSNNKRRRWIAAGIVLVGLAGLNQEPHGTAGARPAGYAPVAAGENGAGFVNGRAGAAADAPRYQTQENEPAMAGGYTVPQNTGFVSSPPIAASDSGA